MGLVYCSQRGWKNFIAEAIHLKSRSKLIARRRQRRQFGHTGHLLGQRRPPEHNVTAPNKGKGRLTGITDQTGSTALVYDERGNVTKETRTIATKAHVVSYVYDLADRITQITYPSGRIVVRLRPRPQVRADQAAA
jgi:YD repeat-containing protein